MERSQKENLVGELQGIFNSATAAVLIDYRGLAANELVEMRQELHKVHSTMKVLKNTLAKLAVEETPFSGIRDQFVDTRALVYGQEDPVEQAKVLVKMLRKIPISRFMLGSWWIHPKLRYWMMLRLRLFQSFLQKRNCWSNCSSCCRHRQLNWYGH